MVTFFWLLGIVVVVGVVYFVRKANEAEAKCCAESSFPVKREAAPAAVVAPKKARKTAKKTK